MTSASHVQASLVPSAAPSPAPLPGTASTSSMFFQASRLLYKALHPSLVPINDAEYRDLIARYRAEPALVQALEDVASGMELKVLDVSERGLVVVPAGKESRFALRMTDLRTGMELRQKAALLLATVAASAVFFPTTEGLEDDNYIPPPASVARVRDTLLSMASNLQSRASELSADLPPELAPGWEYLLVLPVAVPNQQRASFKSLVGVAGLALKQMREGGLVRLDRDSEDDEAETYTATQRLRVQLRDLALRKLFDLAQKNAVSPVLPPPSTSTSQASSVSSPPSELT